MAIERINPENFEFFTLRANPSKTFISSSSGITGSVHLFPRRSSIEKEVQPLTNFSASYYSDTNLDDIRKLSVNSTSSDISSQVSAYLTAIGEQNQSARKQKQLEVIRFIPTFGFTSNTLRKNITRDVLMPFYRSVYPRAHFNYSNYHCLNFFTSSAVPTDSVLLYPNVTSSNGRSYQLTGSFSFDFWIKPKYTTDTPTAEYKPGTILHLSSSYALSLHTGSHRDINGYPDRYQLMLALGDNADIAPSQLNPTASLVVSSSQNALRKDKWHHVTIRWGGASFNFGTGSFQIDGKTDNKFEITSPLNINQPNASVLAVGNYYEGNNSGADALSRFFAADTSEREGLVELNTTTDVFAPGTSSFTHPLNAEVHELKLYNKYLNNDDVSALATRGPTSLKDVKFYLPPFFTYESPFRKFHKGAGGELVTPFFTQDASTSTPFAGEMAFGAGGHYINLENYVRDFATGNYARLWNLTGSAFEPPSSTVLTANQFLYATGSNNRRLYTMMPCDNGDFVPNFDLLAPLSQSRFVDDLGANEIGAISLRDIVPSQFASQAIFASGAILNDVLGAQPETGSITGVPGNSLAVLHRTRDPSSNQVVFFDVSNMFYGNRIRPGSLVLKDSSMSGSGNKFGVTIKDDSRGNLYRADVSGSHPTWASIGNVFYDEGIILLKSPQLFFLGKEQYEVQMNGEQNVHVLTINSFARSIHETTSSNPSFVNLAPNDLAHETDDKFVYITGINIHDDNLNVIARSKLAQPLLKRSGDKFLFKVKLDF